MQITLTDLGIETAKKILAANGFGMVLVVDPYNTSVIESVKIWSTVNEANEPGGFDVGRLTRQFGSFPRYDLMIDDGRVNRSRLHGLMTDLLNEYGRA